MDRFASNIEEFTRKDKPLYRTALTHCTFWKNSSFRVDFAIAWVKFVSRKRIFIHKSSRYDFLILKNHSKWHRKLRYMFKIHNGIALVTRVWLFSEVKNTENHLFIHSKTMSLRAQSRSLLNFRTVKWVSTLVYPEHSRRARPDTLEFKLWFAFY